MSFSDEVHAIRQQFDAHLEESLKGVNSEIRSIILEQEAKRFPGMLIVPPAAIRKTTRAPARERRWFGPVMATLAIVGCALLVYALMMVMG